MERSVQREDRQRHAKQQPRDGFEIIPAAYPRRALVAEITRPQAETRLHRVPAFGAKVGLIEDDHHRTPSPICAFGRSIAYIWTHDSQPSYHRAAQPINDPIRNHYPVAVAAQ
jgi:hypothetical protein